MNLIDLVGIHLMTGIETGTVKRENWWSKEEDDCNYVKFRLDGITYMAVEDPDDGYRSMCRNLEVVDEECRTKLPDILVECKMRDDEHDDIWGTEENDILEFYDTDNKQMFMAVGTGNTNDYYPYFVFEYMPEELSCNSKKG
jgi:hypothetical protein